MTKGASAKPTTKVIFLDCDGVISPFSNCGMFAPEKMRLLKQIVDAHAAVIVLSSSWRTSDFGRNEVSKALTRNGLNPFISCTPSLPTCSRAQEILSWLESNRQQLNIVNFVALDDIDLPMTAPNRVFFAKHAVVTNSFTGITEGDVRQAISLLDDSNNI